MEISLAGKVALVTGAGPNIGSGIALALARYGARVACNDIDPDAAQATVKRIERNGGTAMAVPGDVTDEEQVLAYLRTVTDAWGRLDIVVNNAALLGGRGVLDESTEFFDRAVRVAALGNFLNTKHAGRYMAEHGIRGSIVAISSSNGWSGSAGVIAYAFHKGGVNNFVRAAAMDLAPYGIRVNSFTPTFTQADNPELIAERQRQQASGPPGSRAFTDINPPRLIPMGEQPTPTDYGHVVAFLASDYARLITGTDFRVDGGALAKYWPYIPSEEKAGPLPLVRMDVTE